jgi:DNA (cytosine-5)-methyltransferase 1
MSWLFSRALVAEYSAATSQDGVHCAQLNVMPTQHQFWRNDKMMEPSRFSRFGLTLQLLTVTDGEAILTWFQEDSRAKTSALRGGGDGLDGARSGLWREFARILSEVRPRYALVENSPALTFRGLDRVLADLAALGYDAEWDVFGAYHICAPHKRERIWILAHTNAYGLQQTEQKQQYEGAKGYIGSSPLGVETGGVLADGADEGIYERWRLDGLSQTCEQLRGDEPDGIQGEPEKEEKILANSNGERRCGRDGSRENAIYVNPRSEVIRATINGQWWATEPALGRVADGVANRVDRIRCLGNGQVPGVAAIAWHTLLNRINNGA